jgi:uncharacterized repeat protein (TIGR03803 family)
MPENPSRVTGVRQSPRSVRHASVTYTVLHSFGYVGDGANPAAGLTYFNGTLYGTTTEGGGYQNSCRNLSDGCGTVYSITPSGTETVLHSFKGGEDGASPEARLIVRNGTLYGTTLERGETCRQFGCGTVFSITPSGQETALHGFTGSPDGERPFAPLLNVNGTLYGTTSSGGSHVGANCGSTGCGTVFSITPGGKEKVLYSFGAYGNDGLGPESGLIDVKGTLYGTTDGGGAYNNGTVFSISSGGKEKVVYSFGAYCVQCFPKGLVDVSGALYGTTLHGGAYGDGTVFSITPSGTETVLHSFSGVDGAYPEAALLNVNGTLYGTTVQGGAYGGGTSGVGTVFSITLSGRETVLHSFGDVPGGCYPESGLSYVNGTFYGTASGCGAYNGGTVYSITP